MIDSALCCWGERASMRSRFGLNEPWELLDLALQLLAFPFPGNPRCEINETRQSAAHRPS
jgi:hypothetical protein